MKNNLSILQFVESVWFKRLILHLFPRVVFPSRQYSQDITLLGGKKNKYMVCQN